MSVVIGVDPHKASHTAVVRRNQHEKPLGRWRVRASSGPAEQLRAWPKTWPERY